MAKIMRKQPGQTDDQLIAQFRKKIINEEVLEDASKHDFYQKPSTLKHEKLKEVRKKKRKRKKGKKN